jgi:hypothetical protein
MKPVPSALSNWTPEQIEQGRRWARNWRELGPELERIRREELRRIDPYQVIAQLCGTFDYTVPPRAPKPTSGLIEQQRLFTRRRRP